MVELVLALELHTAANNALNERGDKTAPDILNAEVLHAIRGHERHAGLDPEAAAGARRALVELPITRYPTLPLVERAWDLRHDFTAYDAMYVALAEALGTTFVTADERLARAVRAHTSLEVGLLGGG